MVCQFMLTHHRLLSFSLLQAVIESRLEGGFVEVLADEDEFLHAVAVLVIPIVAQLRIVSHELHQLLFGHGSEPLACLAEVELTAGLLEQIAHIVLFCKIAHTFTADDVSRPMGCDELIEQA